MYYLVNKKENGPIVMILTHARCKRAGLPFDHNSQSRTAVDCGRLQKWDSVNGMINNSY